MRHRRYTRCLPSAWTIGHFLGSSKCTEPQRIGAGGDRWRVQFRTPDHRVTQRRGFETQKEAEGFAATVHVPKMRGEYVDPADVRVTVGDLGPAWLARRRRLKPSSRRVEEVACACHHVWRSAIVATRYYALRSRHTRSTASKGKTA